MSPLPWWCLWLVTSKEREHEDKCFESLHVWKNHLYSNVSTKWQLGILTCHLSDNLVWNLRMILPQKFEGSILLSWAYSSCCWEILPCKTSRKALCAHSAPIRPAHLEPRSVSSSQRGSLHGTLSPLSWWNAAHSFGFSNNWILLYWVLRTTPRLTFWLGSELISHISLCLAQKSNGFGIQRVWYGYLLHCLLPTC